MHLARILAVVVVATWTTNVLSTTSPQQERVEAAVRGKAQSHGSVDVVIEVTPDPPMPFSIPKPVNTEAGRARSQALVADLERDGATEVYNTGVGVILARLTSAALNRVERRPNINAIRVRQERRGLLAEGLDASGFQHLTAQGWQPIGTFSSGGAGEEIVVIDTGFDLTHPAFSGANIHQYCSCGTSTAGCCPNGSNWQDGHIHPGAAQAPALPPDALTALYHGTQVIAAIVSQGSPLYPQPGTYPDGAAPNVKINVISVQGNSWYSSPTSPNRYVGLYNAPGIHAALTQVKEWADAGRKIRAVSMSFGTVDSAGAGTVCADKPRFCSGYTIPASDFGPLCIVPADSEKIAYENEVALLRDRGVLVIAASGNSPSVVLDPNVGAVSRPLPVPACVDGVLPVMVARHPTQGIPFQNLPGPPQYLPYGEQCDPNTTFLPLPQSRQMGCNSTFDPTKGVVASGAFTVPTTRVGNPGQLVQNLEWTAGTSFAAPVVAACAAQIASSLSAIGVPWNAAAVEGKILESVFTAGRPHPVTGTSGDQHRPLLNCHESLMRLLTSPASIKFLQESQSGTFLIRAPKVRA